MRKLGAVQIQCMRQIGQIVVRGYITNRLDIASQSYLVVSRKAEKEGLSR